MRFILIYKYGILQTKTQRIDVNFCQDTTQLLQYLEKRVQQSSQNFIVKFKKGKNSFRIIHGWKLSHYMLKEGTQLHLEILQKPISQKQNKMINSRYLNNVLGINRKQIEEIPQERQKQQQDDHKTFNIRKYLDSQCEKLLKEIQKGNVHGFLQIFQHYPDNIDEQSLTELQSKKPYLIDELGQKGWGPLHYAIFCQQTSIFQQLLEMQVDVNKCTSDGWLPIQLALNLKSKQFVKGLIDSPNINLNLVTSRGSPLHTAVKVANKQLLNLILSKENIDINIKDNFGQTPIQSCLDEECIQLIKKYEEKKQTYNQFIKVANIPISLATIIRGKILKITKPFMILKQRYLMIDPFQNSLIRYQSPQDYPKKPKEIIPLKIIKNIAMIEDSEKSWHMKKQLFYFEFDCPKKQIYACKFKHVALAWIQNINSAIKFSQEIEKNPQFIADMKRNELIVEDKEFSVENENPKKSKKNIFTASMLAANRNSLTSNNSQEHQNKPINLENPNQKQKQKVTESQITSNIQQRNTEQQQIHYKSKTKQNQDLTQQLNTITTTKVNFSSFTIINTLGSGAFGKVFLVKFNPTGKLYALKALKKKNLIVQKQLKYAVIEANILKQANHPFIINLHFAFQTPQYLYLALDYCSGKDLSFHLAREVNFNQDQAKFYIAELILAIQHLHEKKVIYRDLKPQNILLDAKGHIKLADFGLSKQTSGADDKTKSFCGSPAYLSPEMLAQKGAGKESDLYGIGAVLYELLIGEPPYFSDDLATLYRNIKQGKLKFPKTISQSAKTLILGLLERDPKKRLGSKDMNAIKNHPFFNSIDWIKLLKLQIQPPQRPSLQDSDHSQDQLDIIQQGNKKKQPKFNDFDYSEETKKINRLLNFSFVRNQS